MSVFFFFFTEPPSPQNITVGLITVDRILVHWTIPHTRLNVGWMFLVRYVDVSTKQERILGMTNISKISETSLLQSYTAVIEGLASHRKYKINVSTVTQHWIESSKQEAVTVQTGKHVTFCSVKIILFSVHCYLDYVLSSCCYSDWLFYWFLSELRAQGGLVVLSRSGNLTVCWTTPLDDPPDGYYITSHPPIYPTPITLWLNQSSLGVRWVNQSTCVDFGRFTPGQTYEVGVVTLKGNDRSKPTSITHTTGNPNRLDAQPSLSFSASESFFCLCRCRSAVHSGGSTSASGYKFCTATHFASTAERD